MLLLTFIFAGFALFDGVFLWLLAAASFSELERQYPDYVARIYRPPHQVITRQGGPVRLFSLIRESPPGPAYSAAHQMRAMALLFVVFAATSVVAWLVSA